MDRTVDLGLIGIECRRDFNLKVQRELRSKMIVPFNP